MDVTALGGWLSSHTGMSPEILGEASLRRAAAKRMDALAIASIEGYLQRLLLSEEEQDALVDLLVVPETWFFRDRKPFVHLQEHVSRRLAQTTAEAPLRLLSAPCSSGEEPYSMAMALMELGLPTSAIKIDAIDICKASIRKARKGIYSKHSFRGVSLSERRRHFEATAEGFALDPTIARSVQFQRANLMRCLESVSCTYDVVFCRNLLIYLGDEASTYLLQSIARLLAPGGLLVVGSAEMGKVPAELFEPLREPFVFGFIRRDALDGAATGQRQSRSDVGTTATTTAREQVVLSSPAGRRSITRAAATTQPRSGERNWPEARSRRAQKPVDPDRGSPMTDVERCRQRLEREPGNESLYLRMAELLIGSQQRQEALGYLQKYLYLQPQSTEALHQLISLSRELGDSDQRQRYEARLARLQP